MASLYRYGSGAYGLQTVASCKPRFADESAAARSLERRFRVLDFYPAPCWYTMGQASLLQYAVLSIRTTGSSAGTAAASKENNICRVKTTCIHGA
jgi:hypothetical protein